MKTTTSLIDLFSAALEHDASVTLYERRTPGAHTALVAWAALASVKVTTTPIAGGRHAAYSVELVGGAEIKVIVRDVAQFGEVRS